MNTVNIGGVRIQADKRGGCSINGSKAFFGDGSWVDAASNQAFNAGPGRLTVNGVDIPVGGADGQVSMSKAPVSKPVDAMERFSGVNELVVKARELDLTIEVSEDPRVTVHASGSEDQVEAIKLTQNKKTLNVSCQGGTSAPAMVSIGSINTSGSVLSRLFGGKSTSTSTFSSSTSIGSANAQLKITVPAGIDLVLELGAADRCTVGSTKGALKIDLGGSAKVTVGALNSLDARLGGSSKLEVEQVVTSAFFDTSGSSKASVGSAPIEGLLVDSSGSSKVRIAGAVESAHLSASGSSKISVLKVGTVHKIAQSGSGKVLIG